MASSSVTNSAAPTAFSAAEIAELLDQSRAGGLAGLDPRRLGRLIRQLQAARDQAKAAQDQQLVKELAAALRGVKAEAARREEGADEQPSADMDGAKNDRPIIAQTVQPAVAEVPPPARIADDAAKGGKKNDAGTKPEKAQRKAEQKAERQRVKEAEKAEKKRVKEAEKAEKKAEKKAARKAEKAVGKG